MVGNNLSCSVTDPASGRSATAVAVETYFQYGKAGVVAQGGAEFDNMVVRPAR